MMSAIHEGDIEMVKLLVEHGANVNRIHIRNGMLPLDIALSKEYDDITNFFKRERC